MMLVLGAAVLGSILVYWYQVNYYANRTEERLMQRVNAYWEAVRVNDLRTAYEMEAETVNGDFSPDEVEHRRQWDMKIVGYILGKPSLAEDSATIEVKTVLTMMEFDGNTFTGGARQDIWTYVKGDWYHGKPERGGAGIRKTPEPNRFDTPENLLRYKF